MRYKNVSLKVSISLGYLGDDYYFRKFDEKVRSSIEDGYVPLGGAQIIKLNDDSVLINQTLGLG